MDFPSVSDAVGRRLGAEEIAAITRVVESGRLNRTVGSEATAFEEEFATLYGAGHCIASSSGTAALHVAVAAVNPNPGDEIITTGLSDAGSVIPILAQNAVPVFADVDQLTGNLDPDAVRRAITNRTKAILVVHLFGVPARVEELRAIADDHGLLLIEDCSQAYLTTTESGRLAGTVGHLGCFSLQQSKHITTGDGGLTITDDPELARRARLFTDKAWPRDTGERTHLFLGLNYRMTEVTAAIGRAQLPKLGQVVDDRRRTAERFAGAVNAIPGLTTAPLAGTSWWQFPIFVDPTIAGADAFAWATAMQAYGVPVGAGYITRPLYLTPMLSEAQTYGDSGFPIESAKDSYVEGLCPVTESLILGGRLLVVFWNENYTDDHVAALIEALEGARATVTS